MSNIALEHRAMFSKKERRTFTGLRNGPLANVEKRREAFARDAARRRLGADNYDIDLLAHAIDYKDAHTVKKAVHQAAQWIRRQLAGPSNRAKGIRRYVMVSEPLGNGFKSPHWLMHVLAQDIKQWPDAFVRISNLGNKMPALITRHGIRDFVYLDDATYSGNQILEMIDDFADGAERILALRPRDGPINVYIGVGFATGLAKARIQELCQDKIEESQGRLRIHFHASVMFKSIHRIKNALDRDDFRSMWLRNEMDNAPSMSVLAHKVPNKISVPFHVSYALADLATPPYKMIKQRPQAHTNAYWNEGRANGQRVRYFVHPQRNVAYIDVNGRLRRAPSLNKPRANSTQTSTAKRKNRL